MNSRKLLFGTMSLLLVATGCKSTRDWRNEADSHAEALIKDAQDKVTGNEEPIVIESAADSLRRRLMLDQNLPKKSTASLGVRDLEATERWQTEKHLKDGAEYAERWNTKEKVKLSLLEAIEVAAKNNRDFQAQKETLYQSALSLDLEAHDFQTTFRGMLSGNIQSSYGTRRNTGSVVGADGSFARKFKNGVELTSALSVDLAKMLTGERGSSFGLTYDGSISVPLLRGSGKFIVTEPLTQAERNLVYQVREFEQYKRRFVVSIANSYLGVLRSAQTVQNQEESYRRIVTATRRSRRMADAGLMTEYQFDQAIQTELNARESWVSAQQSHTRSLEAFRVLLGLSPDADVEPVKEELDKLLEQLRALSEGVVMADYSGEVPSADADVELKMPDLKHSGPNEIRPEKALALAFENRPDFLNTMEKVEDAQRAVLVAEDSLRAELTLGGSASIGEGRGAMSGNQPDAKFRPKQGSYGALLNVNLPLERTSERNRYRNSLINLEKAVRSFQAAEDQLKQDVHAKLRDMLENRERLVIQIQAVQLAQRRVRSTDMLLQAGRAELRDVLEAQSALTSAQNSLYSAAVSYRINELELQRDLGVLQVNSDGLWKELDLTEYK
ncbi:MAG: TolC family protein [Victivallales bacterium]|nr:TolC family protein [Victivallales bacterium]